MDEASANRKSTGVAADRAIEAWPRGMRVDIAAAYCGISESWLFEEARHGRFPQAVRLSRGRVIWLKEDLDRWLDEKAGRANAAAWAAAAADRPSDWDIEFSGDRAA